jgi:hypothetical protein
MQFESKGSHLSPFPLEDTRVEYPLSVVQFKFRKGKPGESQGRKAMGLKSPL